jgi:hypothetical protein
LELKEKHAELAFRSAKPETHEKTGTREECLFSAAEAIPSQIPVMRPVP